MDDIVVDAIVTNNQIHQWPEGGGAGYVEVQAVKQGKEYDCGLACAAMAVMTIAQRKGLGGWQVTDVYDYYAKISNNNTSIWTVDLFMMLDGLLKNMGEPRPRFTTTVAGCNPMYADTDFYTENYIGDEVRVTRLFKQIKEEGLNVVEVQLETCEVTALLASSQVLLIALIDASLMPQVKPFLSASEFFSCCGLLTSCFKQQQKSLQTRYSPPPPTSAFQGHYILATGYDPRTNKIYIVDPSGVVDEEVDLGDFEHARSAFGTDNDMISIYVGP